MAAVKLVRPVRRDDHDALVAKAGCEEGEERAGRAVGPVEVLEPEDDALILAQPLEEGQQRIEEAPLGLALTVLVALATRWPELRSDSRELGPNGLGQVTENGIVVASKWPDGSDERRVWQLIFAELDALTTENARAERTRPLLELAE
jgi:hypothetical protein